MLRGICFTGVIGADDRHYIHYAYQMMHNTYQPDPNAFYSLRLGLLIPLSLIMRIFGVNELSAIALPLFLSLGTVYLIYLLGTRLFDARAGLIAALLWATAPIDVAFATMLWPDTQMIFLSCLSLLLLLHAGQKQNAWLFFISGLCFGLAYATKIMVVVLIPLIGANALYNIIIRRQRFFRYLIFGAGFLSVFLAESLYFYTLTGDFFFHYHTLNRVYNNDIYSGVMYAASAAALIKRLTILLPFILLFQIFHHALLYWIAPCAVAAALRMHDKATYRVIYWFIGLFILFDCMPTSFTRYQVLYINPREVILLLVPAVLLIGRYLSLKDASASGAQVHRKPLTVLGIILIVILIGPLIIIPCKNLFFLAAEYFYNLDCHIRTFAENRGLFIKLYSRIIHCVRMLAGAAAIFLLLRIFNRQAYLRIASGVISRKYLASLIFFNIVCVLISPVSEARNAKEIFRFLQSIPPKSVYIDAVNKEVLRFYAGFKNDSFIHDLYTSDISAIRDSYVVIDKDLITYTARLGDNAAIEPFLTLVHHPPDNWDLLKTIHPEWENNAVYIYYARQHIQERR